MCQFFSFFFYDVFIICDLCHYYLFDLVYFLLKNLRFYFPASLGLPLEALSLMFTNAFNELAKLGHRIIIGEEPIFNLIPVLGAGRSATSMDDIITCELFARKS